MTRRPCGICAMTKHFDETRLDLTSVDDPICQELFRKFEGAGLSVAVWDITSNIAIAAFACLIVSRNDNRTWHCSVAVGYGCHPARQIALLRALTEAANRLTVISGLRDDLRRDSYEQLLDPDKIAAIRQRISSWTAARHFHDVPDYNGETFEAGCRMGVAMYGNNRRQTGCGDRPYEAGIQVASCSSYCARTRTNHCAGLHSRSTRARRIGRATVSVYIFAGPPFLQPKFVLNWKRYIYRLPLKATSTGSALKRPQAIGIIDGYFHGCQRYATKRSYGQ